MSTDTLTVSVDDLAARTGRPLSPPVVLRRAALVLLTLLHVFLAVNNIGSWLNVTARDRMERTDYVSLAVAGELARQHGDALYDAAAQAEVQARFDPRPEADARPFSNPPFVAAAARLLTAGGFDAGYVALGLLNTSAVVALSVLLARAARTMSTLWRTALVCGALGSVAVANAMAEGAVSVVVALGIALVLLGDDRGDDRLIAAGLILAAIKPHIAVVPFAVLVARRQWRPLWQAAVAGAVLVLPTLFSPGVGAWLRYPAALLSAGGSDSAATEHAEHWWNAASVIYRFFPSEVAGPTAWALFIVGFGLLLHTARHGRWPLPLLMIGSLVVIPHANPHDAIWFPIAFALLWPRWASHAGAARRSAMLALVLSWPAVSLLCLVYADEGGSLVAVAWISAFCWCAAGALGRTGPDVEQPSAEPAHCVSTVN